MQGQELDFSGSCGSLPIQTILCFYNSLNPSLIKLSATSFLIERCLDLIVL